MTPQQYDKINGLNNAGGCLWMICLIGIMPTVFGFTHSPLLALIVGGAVAVAGTYWIMKAKENV